MEKFDSLQKYLNQIDMTVDDLKDMMLTSTLSLGINAVKNFDENVHETAHVFETLFYLNDILDSVE